ncbi:MAG: cytochrome b/b6 domain-containing protein [Gemmatimonadaceae bacterium]|nr:cytochrome b/b6 domain-containing protein [Acetobacteraceae bacterium]
MHARPSPAREGPDLTAQYIILAVLLAFTLNHANRFVRAGGTLLAAVGLAFIVLSIVLADLDGTFAGLPAGLMGPTPLLLNAQAVIASAAVLFLLWASWQQVRRRVTAPVPWRNTGSAFGLVSRYAHWASATLILVLMPMGLFMAVLPEGSPDRDVFMAVHQTLGVTVLVLVLLRLAWLSRSPPAPLSAHLKPWERRLASALHPVLYALILALPVSGLLLSVTQGGPLEIYGWIVPLTPGTGAGAGSIWVVLHNQALPILFYGIIAMHLGAVLKHHFVARRPEDIRRMLR